MAIKFERKRPENTIKFHQNAIIQGWKASYWPISMFNYSIPPLIGVYFIYRHPIKDKKNLKVHQREVDFKMKSE